MLSYKKLPFSSQHATWFCAFALFCALVLTSRAVAQQHEEISKPALAATVWIEKLDATGNTLTRSSGFVVKDGRVATSFRAIDGATSLKLVFADGKEARTNQVAGSNRDQDWALIPIEEKSYAPLALLAKKDWNVGDHCYWLDVKPDGTRVLTEGQVTNLSAARPWGDRIALSGKFSLAALGGPLLDGQGRVIGILGGALPEAFVRNADASAAPPSTAAENVYDVEHGSAIAANLVPQTLLAAPRTLKDLWDIGEMTPAVVNGKYVSSGMMIVGTKESAKKKSNAERVAKTTFQKSDASATVILAFNTAENAKTTAQIKIYDFDNHPVASGEVEKVSLKKGSAQEKDWDIPVGQLNAGIYRVDILVADGIAWREYFKVAE